VSLLQWSHSEHCLNETRVEIYLLYLTLEIIIDYCNTGQFRGSNFPRNLVTAKFKFTMYSDGGAAQNREMKYPQMCGNRSNRES